MSATAALVCIGLTTVDVVALPVVLAPSEHTRLIQRLEVAPAGTAAGTALVAATLGVPTRVIGSVGDDALGRFCRSELARAGVDVSLLAEIPERTTSATLLPIDDEGRRPMFHAPGAGALLRIDGDGEEALKSARAVHWAAIGARGLGDDHGAALLASARAEGALTTCDLIAPGPRALEALRLVLPHVDVFMPSAVEALGLSGQADLAAAAAFFRAAGAGACVIKNGAAGAYADFGQGGCWTTLAHEIDVVDTTSCGDSFCAGFIAATLAGRAPAEALRFAAATAALVAQGPATLGALRSADQVERAMDSPPSRTR